METVGIIAEYNPFHNGHQYHLEQIRQKFQDARIVLVLSGNFTQRGEPSLIDKWTKTKIAKEAGIDLIIELPYPFACQSADFFAKGAITLLDALKVDHLVFGSESNDMEAICTFAQIQLEHPEFQTLSHIYLKEGYNYPTALSKALLDLTGKEMTMPNDLLGISYVKEIFRQKSHIQPHCIQRTSDYHNDCFESSSSSATSIRSALKRQENIQDQVPDFVLPYLKGSLHYQEDYFPFLKYKILTDPDLSRYQLVEEGIEQRIKKEIINAISYEELIQRVKTKRYTYSRLNRMFLHILSGFTKEEAKQMNEITYIRVLGFSKFGRDYLNQIKKEVHLPIISSYAKGKTLPMLHLEFRMTTVYASTLTEEEKRSLIQAEYQNHP